MNAPRIPGLPREVFDSLGVDPAERKGEQAALLNAVWPVYPLPRRRPMFLARNAVGAGGAGNHAKIQLFNTDPVGSSRFLVVRSTWARSTASVQLQLNRCIIPLTNAMVPQYYDLAVLAGPPVAFGRVQSSNVGIALGTTIGIHYQFGAALALPYYSVEACGLIIRGGFGIVWTDGTSNNDLQAGFEWDEYEAPNVPAVLPPAGLYT